MITRLFGRCGARWIVLAALTGLGLPRNPLAAQTLQDNRWLYRAEVFGDVAFGELRNGSASWGRGADFGGGVAVRPFSGWFRRVAFDVRAASLSDSTARGISSRRLDARLAATDLVFHFASQSRVQPYALIGVGLVNVDYVVDCSACVYTLDPATGATSPIPYHWEAKDTKMGITYGFGLKVAVHRRFSVRSELFYVDTTAGSGWNWGWLRFQIGAGVHF